jgi:hypothetical protein
MESKIHTEINIELKLNGITRIVILIGKYAIKIPNFRYSMLHFLQGCYSNWNERQFYKNLTENKDMVCPCYYCTWFGLISLYKRCNPKLEDLTEQEIKNYSLFHNGDYKKENFGYYNNKLVCLDYS